jgi:hypothetical protein
MSLPGRPTSPNVIAVLGRDVFVRLIQISRSGCLLEASHAMPIGAIASLSVGIEGRQYTDEVRVLRSQLMAGAGERYELGVEFLWLRLPGEESHEQPGAGYRRCAAAASGGFIAVAAKAGGLTTCSVAQRTGAMADCAMGRGLDTGHSPNTGEDAHDAHIRSLMDSTRAPEPAGGGPVLSTRSWRET